MKGMTEHDHGTFCRPQLATSDQIGARTFYTALFEWAAEEHLIAPAGTYTIFRNKIGDVAAGCEAREQQRALGIPPHWLSYISVASADDAASRAEGLGGKTLMGPLEVLELGRMAVVQDPAGAAFALWQANDHAGIGAPGQPGTLVWTELITSNAEKAREFYMKLFGWSVQMRPTKWSAVPYTIFMRGDKQAGGMIQISHEMGDIPSHWLPYFGTSDADRTTAKAQQLGGGAIVPPSDVPGIARFAILHDPEGTTFGILSLPPKI